MCEKVWVCMGICVINRVGEEWGGGGGGGRLWIARLVAP